MTKRKTVKTPTKKSREKSADNYGIGIDEINAFCSTDFKHSINYDCDFYDGPPDDDGYCRSGTVSNHRIKSANLEFLSESLLKAKRGESKSRTILRYCIERVLTAFRIYETDAWDFNVVSGYYGQELGSVLLTRERADKIRQALVELVSKPTDRDRVLFTLECEYGYILESLKSRHMCRIEVVKLSDIVMPQESYHSKVMRQDLDFCDEERELPIAVCREAGEKYCVIDGYHRTIFAQTIKKRKATIIVVA